MPWDEFTLVAKVREIIFRLRPEFLGKASIPPTSIQPSDTAGDVLTTQSGRAVWVASGAGSIDLDDLVDVSITAAASGDFLRHNGSAWVDSTIQSADVSALSVGGDLTGTIGNAQIAADAVGASELAPGAVTDAEVSASAAISFSKLATLATGNVLVGVANVATSATPDAAGLVAKSGTQTGIAGAKTWTGTQTFDDLSAYKATLAGSGLGVLRRTVDTVARSGVSLDGSDNGMLFLGSGSASADWRLYRSAADTAALASGDKIDMSAGTLAGVGSASGTIDLSAATAVAVPTVAGSSDSDTSAASTAFVQAVVAAKAINPTIVDAKGDLIVGTAADTVSRLAAGTNEHVLVADSSTGTGLVWKQIDNDSIAAAAGIALSKLAASGSYSPTGAWDFTGGTIAVPTQASSDNDTSAASTAFVQTVVGAHLSDSSAAHAASAISFNGFVYGMLASDVQAGIGELASAILAHLGDTDDAHDASAISVDSTTLVGTGTNVQAVFEEMDDAIAGLVAGTPTVTSTGIIIPSSTNLQQAFAQVEQYVQNVEEAFEQHHHGELYASSNPTKRFKVGANACPAATGNLAVTGVGFRPGLVMFHNIYSDGAIVISGHGAMDASGGQWAFAMADAGAAALAERRSTTLCVYIVNSAGATAVSGTFVSMDADGFTINLSAVDTGARFNWVAYA